MNGDGGNDHWFKTSAKEAWKDIACGSVAGMVAETFKYPFDLAKVRLQSQLLHHTEGSSRLVFKGPLDCLVQTWNKEGLRGLYRGVSIPLAGSSVQIAGLFLTYSSFQRAIQTLYHQQPNASGDHKKPQLTIPQIVAASAGAGFLTSFILTPIELIKCRMQVQTMKMYSQHPAPHPKLSPTSPTVAELLSPTHPTTLTPALQTTAPRSAIQNLIATRTPSPPTRSMFSLTAAPLHTIKLPGPVSIIRSIFQDHGLKGFWLGQTSTMLRGTGGCAIWFTVKEVVTDALQKRRVGLQSNKETNDRDPPRPTKDVVNIMPWESAIAGAAAGAAGTLLLYPADTIKSAIQTKEELQPSARRAQATGSGTFWRTASKMYQVHGLKGLYAGCGMTVARSLPSSGIIVIVYDGLRQWFDKDEIV